MALLQTRRRTARRAELSRCCNTFTVNEQILSATPDYRLFTAFFTVHSSEACFQVDRRCKCLQCETIFKTCNAILSPVLATFHKNKIGRAHV